MRTEPMGTPRIVVACEDWMVVDKPAQWLVHPTRPDGQPTLLGWLQDRHPGEFVALVNRLDRETSGLVLVARHAAAASVLGQQMMRREIHKAYEAVVWGRVEAEDFEVDRPLGRLGLSADNAIYSRQGVVEGGAAARTLFRVLDRAEGFTWLRVEPATGRLHQIRVHAAAAGYPVVGDKIYGPDPGLYLKFIEEGWTEEHEKRLLLPRHALHATTLEFAWQGERVRAETPIPEDLRNFLAARGFGKTACGA